MSLPECLDYAMAYRKDRIASQIDVEIAKIILMWLKLDICQQ